MSNHNVVMWTHLRDAVADLRAEVHASVANADEILPLVLERLRDVEQNACQKDEKKYRKLRCSNPSFAEALCLRNCFY